jgi:hypothetical protein
MRMTIGSSALPSLNGCEFIRLRLKRPLALQQKRPLELHKRPLALQQKRPLALQQKPGPKVHNISSLNLNWGDDAASGDGDEAGSAVEPFGRRGAEPLTEPLAVATPVDRFAVAAPEPFAPPVALDLFVAVAPAPRPRAGTPLRRVGRWRRRILGRWREHQSVLHSRHDLSGPAQ